MQAQVQTQAQTQTRTDPVARSRRGLRHAAQTGALMVLALVAGATFGVWRGYDPSLYAAATFLEMHQGAVRGLNTLLPLMGAMAMLLTLGLAWGARTRPRVLGCYAMALGLSVAAGLVTRLANQPINAQVMGWTAETLPATWESLRDSWWTWHQVRTAFSIAALLILMQAVFVDRDTAAQG